MISRESKGEDRTEVRAAKFKKARHEGYKGGIQGSIQEENIRMVEDHGDQREFV